MTFAALGTGALQDVRFRRFTIETLGCFEFRERRSKISIEFRDGADGIGIKMHAGQKFLVEFRQEWREQFGVRFAVHGVQIHGNALCLAIIKRRNDGRHFFHSQLMRSHRAMIAAQ